MNKDLAQKLRMINKEVPKELRDKLTYKVNPLADQKRKVEEVLRTGMWQGKKLDQHNLRKLNEVYQSGIYHKEQEVIDRKVESQIDAIQNQIIKDKIKSGELPDPKKVVRNDSFFKEQIEKAKQHGSS